jgi:hypothetical protein
MRWADFEAAVGRFEAAYHDDPVAACRRLFEDLLWPVAERAGKPGLVEMSSHNVREAQTLRRLFGEARFLHAVRDGRDSASSVTAKTWGPESVVGAIDWWADRLRRIESGVRGEEDGSPYVIGAERYRVVVLDELVADEREEAYAGLLEFLEIEDEPPMREFFERRMDAGSAHLGRWRDGLGALGRARVRRKYERTLRALEREGNHAAAPLLEAYERSRGRSGATA